MNAGLAADLLMVAAMTASSLLRMRRTTSLIMTGNLERHRTISELPVTQMLEILNNFLSLLGTVMAARLRHSQGLSSFAQCSADCFVLAAICPERRTFVVVVYVTAFVTSTFSHFVDRFHAVGWCCAWVMTAVAIALIVIYATSSVSLSSHGSMVNSKSVLLERACGLTAYTLYLGMLFFDEPATVSPGTSITMFWPWLVNALCNLVGDGRMAAALVLRATFRPERCAV